MRRTLVAMLSLIIVGAGGFWWVQMPDFRRGYNAHQRGDYGAALQEWRPLAEQGNAYAQYWLGLMYERGQGVAPDDTEAAMWYRLAAERGNAYAQQNLDLMYEKAAERGS